MTLNASDYLKWYTDEINRYRNAEWQLAGYSMAISYSSAYLFSTKPDFRSVFIWAIILVVVSITLITLAQLHIHRRLNHYRLRRTALMEDKPHLDANMPSPLYIGSMDLAFLAGFLILPILYAATAISFIIIIEKSRQCLVGSAFGLIQVAM